MLIFSKLSFYFFFDSFQFIEGGNGFPHAIPGVPFSSYNSPKEKTLNCKINYSSMFDGIDHAKGARLGTFLHLLPRPSKNQ